MNFYKENGIKYHVIVHAVMTFRRRRAGAALFSATFAKTTDFEARTLYDTNFVTKAS